MTADGETTRDAWMGAAEKMANAGAKVENLKIEDVGGNKLHYSARIVKKDGTAHEVDSVGTFENNMIVRVEPADPKVYSAILAN